MSMLPIEPANGRVIDPSSEPPGASRATLATNPSPNNAHAAGLPGAWVVGIDEAGRGPLCGEVVAAAVILPPVHTIRGIKDSKRLSAKRREAAAIEIREQALAWGIGTASVQEIDELNIFNATKLAMMRAVAALGDVRSKIELVLVDGTHAPRFADVSCPVKTVVRGDATVACISAASILAKVHRDGMCLKMHEQHPEYGFDVHKGYGTAAHFAIIEKLGPSPLHRKTFEPVKTWLKKQRARALAAEKPTPAAGEAPGVDADIPSSLAPPTSVSANGFMARRLRP